MCQFGAHQEGNTQNHTHTRRGSLFLVWKLLIDVFPASGVQNSSQVSGGGVLQPNTHVFLYVRAPWRQTGLFGDDTHAKRKRSKWACEHELHKECGPLCFVGCEPGPSTWAKQGCGQE